MALAQPLLELSLFLPAKSKLTHQSHTIPFPLIIDLVHSLCLHVFQRECSGKLRPRLLSFHVSRASYLGGHATTRRQQRKRAGRRL